MPFVAFPNSNYQDLDLDWLLDEMKSLKEQIEDLDERVTALEPVAETPVDEGEVDVEITPA